MAPVGGWWCCSPESGTTSGQGGCLAMQVAPLEVGAGISPCKWHRCAARSAHSRNWHHLLLELSTGNARAWCSGRRPADAAPVTLPEPIRGRRPSGSWIPVSHGLHRPRGSTSDLPAWQLVLPPSGRFTGLTAAGVLHWSLPPLPPGLPVFAGMSTSDARRHRKGLVLCRHAELAEPIHHEGLWIDPPAEVLLACGRDLSVLDLVVLIDSALAAGHCTRQQLASVAARRRRGAPRLRRALALADSRSESAWETLLRVMHVTCEIPVEPQFTLRDEHGHFLARADLWVRDTNALHEYDGHHHLSRRQQRLDLRRARRLGNDEWLRRGYTSADLLHQAVTILRDADLSLGREHRPARIRTWHALLKDSLFTPTGQERLRLRLNLARPSTVLMPERTA